MKPLCPRCRGMLLWVEERDWLGRVERVRHCIACSYTEESPSQALARIEILAQEAADIRQRRRRPTHGSHRL